MICVLTYERNITVLIVTYISDHICIVFNPLQSGGAFKSPPPNFCPHAFNFGATLLCVPKNSDHHVAKKKIFIGGQDLAIWGVKI